MVQENRRIKKYLYSLIIISLIIRAFLANTLELGNDEAYYWTYALYPDLSHFDHPPMVGWMMQLFSFNLLFDNEFFLRLSSVVFGTINILLVYKLGCLIKNPLTGLYASFLYVASIYFSIIVGVFILPDGSLILFWLISIYIFLSFIKANQSSENKNQALIWIGISAGLAILSKYNGIFIWIGVFVYLLLYKRKILTKFNVWLGAIISIFIFLPVIIWNFQYNFVSFDFQGNRVNFFEKGITFNHIGAEILGQMAYLNPFVFVLIWASIFLLIRKNNFIDKQIAAFLLLTGLPIIGLMLFFSLFRTTLPHWSIPGYLSLLFIPAAFLAEKKRINNILMPKVIKYGLLFILIVISIGLIEVKTGFFQLLKITEKDFTLDIFGWKQAGEKFILINNILVEQKRVRPDALILSWRWFPGANQDYYIARKTNKKMILIGNLDKIHKYAWINRARGGIHLGDDAYFLVSDHDARSPSILEGLVFDSVIAIDTILVKRNQQSADKILLYLLKGLKSYEKKFVLPEIFLPK